MDYQLFSRIEALLFAWGDALSYQKLARLTGASIGEIKQVTSQMHKRYQAQYHGIDLIEVNQSVQLVSKHALSELVQTLFETDRTRGLSKSLLEVLAIVAYKQPITKTEIETIRGVGSERSLQQLIDIGFVYISGTLQRVGRPNLYSTTDLFLKKFGLKTLRELPAIESFERLQLSLEQAEADSHG